MNATQQTSDSRNLRYSKFVTGRVQVHPDEEIAAATSSSDRPRLFIGGGLELKTLLLRIVGQTEEGPRLRRQGG
jgi:hypothetical protein